MQLVANGPDIPDALLEAHEEGRVVFFCGAGISYPAGLPGFKGLVDEIYRRVGTTSDPIEREAYNRNQFDATLDLLERRLPGQRLAVRRAVADVLLKPKLRRKGAVDTHSALLQLARTRGGAMRLVTTNFDRVFVHAMSRTKMTVPSYQAPLLPIPKSSRWNGLVYLHGLLPKTADDSALNRLVLTSGDFGLAYLTERWAARFVSELFRNYLVCFIGYSINDPVLRYMMDALAADRMLGELTPQAYALGDTAPAEEKTKAIEWEAKGVKPILYEVPAGTADHSALHRTLKAWAGTYRDGVLGRERIVVEYAISRPSASTRQDDFVGRMLWALSHESGLPAKRFAEFSPVPPLDWLEALSSDRYVHGDLTRFNVQPRTNVDDKLRFSMVRRPAPYLLAPWMTLACSDPRHCDWDDVMRHLARWLVRHLDDPALVLWLIERGGELHDQMARLVEDGLETFSRLEAEDGAEELRRIRADAPNAVPRPLMRLIWRLLLTRRVKSPWRDSDLYLWKDQLKREGLTATLRLAMRELLAPKVELRKPFRWHKTDPDGEPERLRQLFDWELVLAASHARSSLADLANDAHWRSALPFLLDDFQQLLRDALDLLHELGVADARRDSSHWAISSISPHPQNQGFREWVALVEMVRDSWLAVHGTDSIRARQIAQAWFSMPYPTFKRLALFAASKDGCISSDQWVSWLVADDSWWLWSVDTRRETLRLLVLQGVRLTEQARERLEAAILAGPPRVMYPEDLEPDRRQALVDHSIWLRLAKLQLSGVSLAPAVAERLATLSQDHPSWRLEDNESDEFSHWVSGTGDPDFEASRHVEVAPRRRDELVAWLKAARSQGPFHEDTWRDTCSRHFLHAALALSDLAGEGHWPTERWREALQEWSKGRRVRRSWQFINPLLLAMPAGVVLEIAHSITWWLEAVSKTLDRNDVAMFLQLCRRILEMPHPVELDGDQVVLRAINHPVGHITQALLNLWLRREPNDDDRLPEDLAPFFTRLSDTRVALFRYARVLLSAHIIPFFRTDKPWTNTYLLPLFDWTRDVAEAQAAWKGFLWSPRLHRPLLIALKPQFIDTAHQYTELGEHARPFTFLLVYAALQSIDTYTEQDFQRAFEALPQEGLHEAADALVQALEGAGTQREEYWLNRVKPFWQAIWPKSLQLASNRMAETLARLTIAAANQFPAALATVIDWLHPTERPDRVIHLLQASGLSAKFPQDALRLLDAVIDRPLWAFRELAQCLRDISQAAPELTQDQRYRRLDEYARRRGS